MNSMKRQNDKILKGELPGSVGAQYSTGDQWRNNSRKNEEMGPKQKEYPAVDVTGDSVVKNLPANAGDRGSIPAPGRSYLSWDDEAYVPQLLKPTYPRAWVAKPEKPAQ